MELMNYRFERHAWVPSRRTGIHVAVAGLAAAVLWFGLLFSLEPSRTVTGIGMYVAGALILGGAFGCAYGALFLFLNALLTSVGLTRKQLEPPHRAIRVAFLFWCAHVGLVGLLALFGLWRQPWPWAYGLLPFLWH